MVTFVLQKMRWEYKKHFPGTWDSLEHKGPQVGTRKMGSKNEHSSLTYMKDSCRES